jgi:hypothetical protein
MPKKSKKGQDSSSDEELDGPGQDMASLSFKDKQSLRRLVSKSLLDQIKDPQSMDPPLYHVLYHGKLDSCCLSPQARKGRETKGKAEVFHLQPGRAHSKGMSRD